MVAVLVGIASEEGTQFVDGREGPVGMIAEGELTAVIRGLALGNAGAVVGGGPGQLSFGSVQ